MIWCCSMLGLNFCPCEVLMSANVKSWSMWGLGVGQYDVLLLVSLRFWCLPKCGLDVGQCKASTLASVRSWCWAVWCNNIDEKYYSWSTRGLDVGRCDVLMLVSLRSWCWSMWSLDVGQCEVLILVNVRFWYCSMWGLDIGQCNVLMLVNVMSWCRSIWGLDVDQCKSWCRSTDEAAVPSWCCLTPRRLTGGSGQIIGPIIPPSQRNTAPRVSWFDPLNLHFPFTVLVCAGYCPLWGIMTIVVGLVN